MLVRPVRLGVLAAIFILVACGKELRLPVADTEHVVLRSGVTHGYRWDLVAWRQGTDGPLCLTLAPQGPAPGATATGGDQGLARLEQGGCGFPDQASGTYWLTGDVPGGQGLAFGPVPAGATSVRLGDGTVVPTHPFPPERGLPDGRFWVAPRASEDPAAALAPQPLDAAGRPVPFQRF